MDHRLLELLALCRRYEAQMSQDPHRRRTNRALIYWDIYGELHVLGYAYYRAKVYRAKSR